MKQVSREVKAVAKLSVAEKPPRRPVCAGPGDGGGAASSSCGAAVADAAPSGALALAPKTRLEERAHTLNEARKLLPKRVGCTVAVRPTSGWMARTFPRGNRHARGRGSSRLATTWGREWRCAIAFRGRGLNTKRRASMLVQCCCCSQRRQTEAVLSVDSGASHRGWKKCGVMVR